MRLLTAVEAEVVEAAGALAAVVVTHLLLAEEAVATHQLPAVEVAVGIAVDKV